MGRKHQVYIIARLIPHDSTTGKPYYCCIGGHHHQSCYGTLPLAATHRFLALIKNEDNAEIIRDELRRRAQHKYYGLGREEFPFMPAMSCPYTLLLLTQAWNMDLGSVKDAYASGYGLENDTLDPNMGTFQADNDEGITIIDVTDPSDPAYCFVPEIYKSDAGPVDVRGYVAKHDEERSIAACADKFVSNFEGVRVLTSDVLVEAWPDEYKSGNPRPEIDTTMSAEPQSQTVPSLVDLALSPAVDHALASDDIEQLEYLLMIPGKADLVKKFLMTKNPLPDSGTALLTDIITQEFESTSRVVLDLSEYPYLSSDQVVHIVNAFANTLPGRIRSLKLSGNQNISTATVVKALEAFPQLLRLVLLNTSITDDRLLELISTSPNLFFNLHDLVHPAFLVGIDDSVLYSNGPVKWETTLHPVYRHGLTFVSLSDCHEICTASVPFFNPEQLLIKLTRPLYMTTHCEDDFFDTAYAESRLGPILALSAGTTVVDPSGRTRALKDGPNAECPLVSVDGGSDWQSRSVVSFPQTGSLDCFKGVGWMFVLNLREFGSVQYGFVKVDGRVREKSKENGRLVSESYTIYDVEGFLGEMEKEGRPVPSEGAVAAFIHALGKPLSEKDYFPFVRSIGLPGRPIRIPKLARLISDGEFLDVVRVVEGL
ncbi:hypothetical protein K435DRAFT_974256 [Dendrothele bispora CBS 962.96]|uniref:RNI-like protein n=1 Tax=Dendrothele bispora (strain CBS 962.96) TaxID=1314807 RepID=A0A4S8KMU3_DENBC|nr:hypothetical protein K435DRAFT_974256 [Dendrothele bispora CBS 962.96]